MGARYFDIYGSNISIDDYPTMVASPDNYIHLTTWSLKIMKEKYQSGNIAY